VACLCSFLRETHLWFAHWFRLSKVETPLPGGGYEWDMDHLDFSGCLIAIFDYRIWDEWFAFEWEDSPSAFRRGNRGDASIFAHFFHELGRFPCLAAYPTAALSGLRADSQSEDRSRENV